jgi:hypothetical protein
MGAAEETPPRISGQGEQEARPEDIFFSQLTYQKGSADQIDERALI